MPPVARATCWPSISRTARTVWRKDTKTLLAGGTGAGDGLVVVGSSEGVVIALNAKDGAERWRAKVNGEVLSAPAVSAKAVVVRTVDGKLRGSRPRPARSCGVRAAGAAPFAARHVAARDRRAMR